MNINVEPESSPAATNPAPTSRWRRLFRAWHWPTDPKQRLWARLSVIIIIGAILGGVIWAVIRQSNNKTADDGNDNGAKIAEEVAAPTTVNSVLDGLAYDAALAGRRPIAVMVENHPDARPQFGLSRASVVYEAIAEGGITRYMAIFGPQDTERVGPIRSARTYYIDWATEYNAIYTHAGGASNALEKLRTGILNDIDQQNPPTMWRQRRAKESSEHTLYSSTIKLRDYAIAKGWSQAIDVAGWTFVADARPEADRLAAATAKTVTIPWSSASFQTAWTYDATKNVYLRALASKSDTDAATNEQLSATNLVIQVMNRKEITAAGKTVGDLTLYGSGDAWVVKGGQFVKGTWKKEKEKARTRYYDGAGVEIPLIPGRTWVSVIQPNITPAIQ
jgi:hypothetical protein